MGWRGEEKREPKGERNGRREEKGGKNTEARRKSESDERRGGGGAGGGSQGERDGKGGRNGEQNCFCLKKITNLKKQGKTNKTEEDCEYRSIGEKIVGTSVPLPRRCDPSRALTPDPNPKTPPPPAARARVRLVPGEGKTPATPV